MIQGGIRLRTLCKTMCLSESLRTNPFQDIKFSIWFKNVINNHNFISIFLFVPYLLNAYIRKAREIDFIMIIPSQIVKIGDNLRYGGIKKFTLPIPEIKRLLLFKKSLGAKSANVTYAWYRLSFYFYFLGLNFIILGTVNFKHKYI